MMKLNNVARREENERSRYRKPCCTSASAGNAAAYKSKSLFLLLFSKMIPISHRNNPDCPEYDEYIPGEKREPIGLYKLTHDDEGNPIIEFDDPMKADNVSPQEAEGRQKKLHPPKVSQDEKRKRVPQIPIR